jgi:Ankyrin repeats (3 copies)
LTIRDPDIADVLYVHLARDGGIYLVDGQGAAGWAPLAALQAHVARLRDAGGSVLYSREAPDSEATGQQHEAFAVIAAADVPVVIAPEAHPDTVLRGGVTTLMAMSYGGELPVVEDLLSRGADPNAADEAGYTALMYAAQAGQAEVVESLLRAGAAVDAVDVHGNSALFFAAQSGVQTVTSRLIEAGASPAVRDGAGRTPADVARAAGHNDVAALLETGG